MKSFNHHRIFLQILCVMLLFAGNSLFSFSPNLNMDVVNPELLQKYFGVTFSQK